MYKILNLYACLGGNRYKWNDVSNDIQVTAVELDKNLAHLYKKRFPNDKIIITDAHKYLLDNYQNFDFIWSSPPCPSHSRARFARKANTKPMYPDLKLYEEIIFLQHNYTGKFCIENVVPYYEPLIPGKKRGRHIYWTNFSLPTSLNERKSVSMECKNEVDQWCKFHNYDFYQYKGKQRIDKIARNLVDYEAGKTILSIAMDIQLKETTKQIKLTF